MLWRAMSAKTIDIVSSQCKRARLVGGTCTFGPDSRTWTFGLSNVHVWSPNCRSRAFGRLTVDRARLVA